MLFTSSGLLLLIGHGHVQVNDRKVDISSFLVRAGDVVSVKEKAKKNDFLLAAVDSAKSRGVPPWLALDSDSLRGTVSSLPTRGIWKCR